MRCVFKHQLEIISPWENIKFDSWQGTEIDQRATKVMGTNVTTQLVCMLQDTDNSGQ